MNELFSSERMRDTQGGPLYIKLCRLMEQAIARGDLKHGDALPPEREIAELSGVSRITVRKAIDRLVTDGMLVKRHGSGTYISRPVPHMQQQLKQLTSFSEDMRRRGMTAGSRWIGRGLYAPNLEETMTLGLASGVRVARLERLRTADDMVIALERTSLPEDILPNPDEVKDSLYEVLGRKGLAPVRANQRISAVALEAEDAALIEVAAGAPALSVQRLAYLANGRAMEVSRALYRSDAYDLIAELTIDRE